MKTRVPRLLVVEDCADDERLIKRALQRMERDMDVEYVHDGEEALNRLCRGETGLPMPDLVLLDWKMPKVRGADVLRQARNSDRCRGLVIVVFSSSDEARDKDECQSLGGNAYRVKPVDYDEFLATVQGIVSDFGPKIGKRPRFGGVRAAILQGLGIAAS